MSEKYISKVSVALLGLILGVAAPLAAQKINACGATFPDPIYKKWFSDYAAKTHVQINYQPIGSGGGIRQVTSQTVFFGATAIPLVPG